jgi:hypothetical protein
MPQFSGNLLKLTLHTNKNQPQIINNQSRNHLNQLNRQVQIFMGLFFCKTPLVLIALQIEQSDLIPSLQLISVKL